MEKTTVEFKSIDDLLKMKLKITIVDGKMTIETPEKSPRKTRVKSVKVITPPTSEEEKQEKESAVPAVPSAIEGVEVKLSCDICGVVVCRAGLTKHKRTKKCQETKIKQVMDAVPEIVVSE